ncbi:MAG: aldo/keto reductase [Kiritimatiellae bacterium]|nr:aldo/keto reductase [Kiritimatiellia bacterium]
MQYRAFGKTGLKVSVLGFGTSSLGSVFREIDEQAGIRATRLALDQGINFIDSAPYYGLTRAETVLGKALKGVPRERYILATKVGRYGHELDGFDFSASRVTRSIDESLARLGVDHIDVIQVHDIEFGALDQIVAETLPALRRVQDQGKVRYVGITGLPLNALRYVMDRAEVDTVQTYCHYCLNDSSLARLLPYLTERAVGVVSSAPLAMRLLTEAGPPDWHPAPPEIRARCAEAARFCRERGADIAKLALQFAVSNPAIHTTVVSTASPDRLAQNVGCIREPIDHALVKDVLGVLAPIHNETWPQGRAENNRLPDEAMCAVLTGESSC